MVLFKKKPMTAKPDQASVPVEVPGDETERVEESEAARCRKADSDGTHRRARQAVEDNRLL